MAVPRPYKAAARVSERAEHLYERAHELHGAARKVFIDAHCQEDPALRDELLSLLNHSEAAEEFFELLGGAVVTSLPSLVDSDVNVGRTVGRYRIVARIGSGGMGTVYRAHDAQLDRDVALKFLPPYLSGDPGAQQRLLAEARAAAALEHPNVCSIHEVGETEDRLPFIAMALCSGETLKHRIRRGPLPIADVITIAKQIVSGLGAAHVRGIVHRDVKPGNIMLDADGTVRLVDFGLAKVSDATLSRPGPTPGTLAYMAPEQARGDPVDQRSDLWSLGVVLYEMVTGVRPFQGGSDGALLDAILRQEPESLSKLRADAPPQFVRVVERLLRKDPTARFQSATDVGAELSGVHAGETLLPRRAVLQSPSIATAAAIALIASIGVAFWLRESRNDSRLAVDMPADRQRVLVADFTPVGSDSLLADAVAYALRVDLARSQTLRVAGTGVITAALQRMRKERDTRLSPEIARELAVREGIPAVIEGEIRKVGSSYVVSATIVEASSGEVVNGWREAARDSTEIVDAIDRLSRTIRKRLGESLPGLKVEEGLYKSTTSSLAALRKHAQATHAFRSGDMERATMLYEETLKLDSTFAFAYIGLAYAGAAILPRRRILEVYTKAYELRDSFSETDRHAVTGNYYHEVVGDHGRAIEAFRKQVEAAKLAGETPLHATVMGLLVAAGDFSGAEEAGREAGQIRPTPLNRVGFVHALYRRGNEREALAALDEALKTYPRYPYLNLLRVQVASAKGEYEVADSLADALLTALVDTPHLQYAYHAAVRGQIDKAIEHLRAVQRYAIEHGHIPNAVNFAISIGRLRRVSGNSSRAVRELSTFVASVSLDSIDALDRPYLSLAQFYAEAGEPRRARQYLAAYETQVPSNLQRVDRWSLIRTRAAIALAEGTANDAVSKLDSLRRIPKFRDATLLRIDESPEMARAYDRAHDVRSAIAIYERYITAQSLDRIEVDAFELGPALYHVAQLYEGRNDRVNAARYYGRFAELWKNADAELQPKVQLAKRSADELMAARH